MSEIAFSVISCVHCHEKISSDGITMLICVHMFSPPSEQVAFRCHHRAEVTVKFRHWHCLGRVNMMCDEAECRVSVGVR